MLDKVGLQFNGSVCGRVYNIYIFLNSHVMDTEVFIQANLTPSLPALWIIQCHRRGPLPGTVGPRSPSLWQM